MDHKSVFNKIYNDNAWGCGSGWGSVPKSTEAYRQFIMDFIRFNEIKSVLDIGCGDWQFSKLIDWSGIQYTGLDVSDVVLSNTKNLARPGVSFIEANALTDPLPEAELVLIKDVLQHWSNVDIINFLPRLGKFDRALITNGFSPGQLVNTNKDIKTGGWRPVDLIKQPFNLKGSYIYQYVGDEPKRIFLLNTI
jgi:SAM-dependent methyltransferase